MYYHRRYRVSPKKAENLHKDIKSIITSESFWNQDRNTIFSTLKEAKSLSSEDASIITKRIYEKFGPSSAEVLFILNYECGSFVSAIDALGPFAEAQMIKTLINSFKKSDHTPQPLYERFDNLTKEMELLRQKIDEYKAAENAEEGAIQVDYEIIINKLKSEITKMKKEKDEIRLEFPSLLEKNTSMCVACKSDLPVKGYFCHCETCSPDNLDARICLACALHCHHAHRLSSFETREDICSCRTPSQVCHCCCNYIETGRNYIKDTYYICRTCFPDSDKALCGACAANCHKGHDLEKITDGVYFCDCGAENNEKCICMPICVPVNPLLAGKSRKMISIPYNSD